MTGGDDREVLLPLVTRMLGLGQEAGRRGPRTRRPATGPRARPRGTTAAPVHRHHAVRRTTLPLLLCACAVAGASMARRTAWPPRPNHSGAPSGPARAHGLGPTAARGRGCPVTRGPRRGDCGVRATAHVRHT